MVRGAFVHLLVAVAACGAAHEPPGDGGPDAGADVGLPPLAATSEVDLLFVVDDSGYFWAGGGIALLRATFETLVTDITNSDGPRARDLHVGVVTTDMGLGQMEPFPGCEDALFGHDARLRTFEPSAPPHPACEGAMDPYLTWTEGAGSLEDLVARFDCRLPYRDGCIEQPLEAMLKALTPSMPGDGEPPIEFSLGTGGQGDRANAGFLRDDSLLVVVLLSDKTDCSAEDPTAFFAVRDESILWRCARESAAMHPIERYVEGLSRVRPDPRRLLFVPIVGVPSDLTVATGEVNASAILADPRMTLAFDESAYRVVPSCDPPGLPTVWATPPRRIVAVAGALRESTFLVSACEDFSPSTPFLAEEIRRRLAGSE